MNLTVPIFYSHLPPIYHHQIHRLSQIVQPRNYFLTECENIPSTWPLRGFVSVQQVLFPQTRQIPADYGSSIIGEKSYPRHQRSLPDGTYSPSGLATDRCAMKSLLTECYHFAFCSAPKLFSAVADALQQILSIKGIIHSLHYLDDYIMVTDSLDKALIQKAS